MNDSRPIAPIHAQEAEQFLDLIEKLHGIAQVGEWERWYFVDEDGRIVLETSDLWAICWFGAGGTPETVTDRAPFALRHWAEQEKFYLTAQDDRREGATDRYFVDYAAATRETADHIREVVRGGVGRTRSREEMLNDPEQPRCAEALRDWELGDDSVGFVLGRTFCELYSPNFKEARAKLRWGMIDGIEGARND